MISGNIFDINYRGAQLRGCGAGGGDNRLSTLLGASSQ
jgi:hypothetical protein